ncbi:hypothetical protein KTE26_19350 [Ralstonia mannitolilytica]|uniref:NERD domain-containing protein n=1 Tax=Pseudomonadota TaxID=1224 RepID=UPI000CEDDB27|nr:NERD domain-containing protein [Ralstonia mannitolilytica]MBU9580597.1 hypothetical protein [Ralstonia mannitolilytica]CAJ0780550.1 hypothetical protein LMG18090_01206 [Ralstonia mannitolilytica]
MTIEIFTGGRRSFRGEGAVLTVIEGILRAQGEDAVILRNVRVVVPKAETKRTAEVDLFVATTRVTLAIQVKNYRLRVLDRDNILRLSVTTQQMSPWRDNLNYIRKRMNELHC